ncbi:MAG: hypothetical protein ACSI46_13505 [Gloeotrichia echinulata DVL01]
MRSAVRHHLHTLQYSDIQHEIYYYNCLMGAPSWLRYFDFDAIILHTTFLGIRWSKVFEYWKWQLGWIKDVNCVKIAIPQDEYDYSKILDEWFLEWNVSVIFSNFNVEQRKILYPKMHKIGVFYQCLTGYIDDKTAQEYAKKAIPIYERNYDIIYRARHLPYKFGSHGQLKHQIADIVKDRANLFNLKCDISTLEIDTILGDKWFDFLASSKTIIGCESGSSVLDKDGEIQLAIQKLLENDQEISFEEVDNALPQGWDDYQFFAISPRHFEAIITKSCQILVEGYYDGILEPHRHYIPIKKDFSNLDEVLNKITDIPYVMTITECAYKEIYISGKYSYNVFAKSIEKAIETYKNGKKSLKHPNIYSHFVLDILLKATTLIDDFIYNLIYNYLKTVFRFFKKIVKK